MTSSLQSFINTLKGKWISHQTKYDLTNRRINTNQFEKEIILIQKPQNTSYINYGYICKYQKNNNKYSKEIIYNYITNTNSDPILGELEKIDKNLINTYIFTLHYNYHLKIKYIENNIQYTEYIYNINNNFNISVVIIKKFNKYIAICFISEIKMIQ